MDFKKYHGNNFTEDSVDIQLWTDKGLIERGKDRLCRHGPKAKCVHCTPLEPYDEAYMKEHNIKHMSFHSYLRKMTAGVDRGKFAALDNISCKIKEGCKDHSPWPAGICTKCQPSAITLTRQDYRHVDNIVFENAKIVERFLDYWRFTGHQRIGFLYGYYEVHKDLPLGIKTTVVAIYEPPQETGRDFVKLNWPEPNQTEVDSIAKKLNLQRVGWIFTDLIPDDVTKGTVKHLRSADSYFLSAQECILAGHFQNVYPNACRLSTQGYFGSKFVTVCVTGDKDNQIHMEGYQVSNQCMALVNDNCLLPTRDAPELAFVRETTKDQYVPDVFYTEKDKFGNEIKKVARTLPVEYLLVDVPVSAPVEPKFTFNCTKDKNPFPIENRSIQGHIQDFQTLTNYLSQFTKAQFLLAAQDFHFILYIATMDMLPLKGSIDPLLEAINSKNSQAAIEWTNNDEWQTVEQLIAAQSSSASSQPSSSSNVSRQEASAGNGNDDITIVWSCSFCTFENPNGSGSCEMCGLPRHSG
ncbi:nuclear protein localization protein 4 homolog [Tetranychus urticae]|uniref:Nuclear protein localization protein 4 homolog n=1 Tax=Tetranychus urticae TaxID=32264 RepID=T1JQQ6_TETUR|nr:nuclear protein localization protein 4 homolog [Tetranychus urticae]